MKLRLFFLHKSFSVIAHVLFYYFFSYDKYNWARLPFHTDQKQKLNTVSVSLIRSKTLAESQNFFITAIFQLRLQLIIYQFSIIFSCSPSFEWDYNLVIFFSKQTCFWCMLGNPQIWCAFTPSLTSPTREYFQFFHFLNSNCDLIISQCD